MGGGWVGVCGGGRVYGRLGEGKEKRGLRKSILEFGKGERERARHLVHFHC
jgi:hypothetical protein